jgi:hypothetical protein
LTEYEYIIDSPGLKERYDRIQSIIRGLEIQQLQIIGNCDVDSYTLNDGQIQISTRYRSPEQIQKAIDAYEKISNRILYQLTGTRVVRLADAEAVQSNGITRRF